MSAPSLPTRVIIADDHKLFREGLKTLLQRDPGIRVVGEARNGEEAVALSESLTPDVILMDIEMPIIDGIEATRLISQKNLLTKVLMLSNFEEDERVYQAMLAGAKGYVVKRIGTTSLIGILKAVQNNELLVTPYLASLVLRENSQSADKAKGDGFNLTEREVKILELLVKGYSNKEISNTIYISVDTVKAHLKHIFDKLGVDCRTKAAVKAIKHNIVPEPQPNN
ncbi:MAG TPA: response regulator transcription factor [Blastocatellia bacterium]|nr:response regulator transcription factor [Blastocatellia bacterium]